MRQQLANFTRLLHRQSLQQIFRYGAIAMDRFGAISACREGQKLADCCRSRIAAFGRFLPLTAARNGPISTCCPQPQCPALSRSGLLRSWSNSMQIGGQVVRNFPARMAHERSEG